MQTQPLSGQRLQPGYSPMVPLLDSLFHGPESQLQANLHG